MGSCVGRFDSTMTGEINDGRTMKNPYIYILTTVAKVV